VFEFLKSLLNCLVALVLYVSTLVCAAVFSHSLPPFSLSHTHIYTYIHIYIYNIPHIYIYKANAKGCVVYVSAAPHYKRRAAELAGGGQVLH
jgi:hypothetical protein